MLCVDLDGDGRREIPFASRKTGHLQLLDATTGKIRWSKKLAGHQQSLAAYDPDDDGKYELLYSVSSPGRLYILDAEGNVKRQFDSGDGKLGNSAVVLDSDGDGKLEGYFGSRTKYLLRVNMADMKLLARRDGWVQCGCYTSALDVDRDGRWDLFAGSGDDGRAKGVLHRYDPLTLKTVWSHRTDDNASSADAVLVDLDGDGRVEIVKSVDNYAGDDAHDAVYAFNTEGKMLWNVAGLSGEDSPNVADLDGDGEVEIVGMTFGGEVYCLDAMGRFKWRKDLRPELDDHAHAYLAPILCDLDGKPGLEILALTNGGYFDTQGKGSRKANGILFALTADGRVLDRFDVGGPRYWGDAFVCNIDDDPQLEAVISGSGGLDVIQLQGFGPDSEHFQRRRDYRRLNVLPWAYEETFFIHRGQKQHVANRTDNLVLVKTNAKYRTRGVYTTDLLTLPPGFQFDSLTYQTTIPPGTNIAVNILDARGKTLHEGVQSGRQLALLEPVRIQFVLTTNNSAVTPLLDSYRLRFSLPTAGRSFPGQRK